MGPVLRDGDTVSVVRAVRSDLEPGDIVVFRAGEELVVHRLISVGEESFLEMGDNRTFGVRHPWPDAMGRVRSVWMEGGEVILDGEPERRAARAKAGRMLRKHRAEALASRLPGDLLPRILRAFARRILK